MIETAIAPPLALTMGDPNGIGPEITARAWDHLRHNNQTISFVCLTDFDTAARACALFDLPKPQIIGNASDAADIFPHALPIMPLTAESRAGKITQSIERAAALTLAGEASGVVTNPIAKHVLYEAGFTHPGHTEFLGELTADTVWDSPRGPVMMLAGGGLSVALATIHIPLTEVASQLTTDGIVRTGRVMADALTRDFGIDSPRIALTGLNPHAGENGTLGTQEDAIINPAAAKLRALGIDATDAQPADTLFHAEAREGYDAVLAMYHDQGLIPVKTLDFHGGVNITLGLPIIRTSPDHGTAFDIAGKGIARPDSLIAALKTAKMMARNRARHAR